MMSRCSVATLALLATAQLAGAFVATPGALSLRAPGRMLMATARTAPRMAEQEPESVAVESETRIKGLEARSTSWLSRNLSEERRNQRTFYDIEKRGELLRRRIALRTARGARSSLKSASGSAPMGPS